MKRRISTYMFQKPSILTESFKEKLPEKVKNYSNFISSTDFKEAELAQYNKEYLEFLKTKNSPTNGVKFMYSTHLLRPLNFHKFMVKNKLKYPNSWFKVINGEVKKNKGKDIKFENFSLDLIEEAKAQIRFNQRIKTLDIDEDFIEQSIDRYEKFFELRYEHPKVPLVPTIDIDLVWHTHQLDHTEYVKQSKEFLGFVMNHNDQASEKVLMNVFSQTRKLWKQKYGDEYLEYKYKKKSKDSVSGCFGCLSCGFGHHSTHQNLPHNTGDMSQVPSLDSIEIGDSLGGGDVDVGGSTCLSCLSCIADAL